MKEYYVTLEEIVRYTVTVVADSEDDAGNLAMELWCQSEDPTSEFDGSGQGVEVTHCETTSETPAKGA